MENRLITNMIPLCKPYLDEKEYYSVKKSLESSWFTYGPNNKEFERRIKALVGSKYALSLNSATSALQISLIANKISGEVIVPSFTFSATINAISVSGAIPVFCDIDYGTCNMDISHLKSLISPRTEAIMPVHFSGQPCDMSGITNISKAKGLKIIEDSAETLGATFEGKQAGSFGDGCFSFFPTKIITTGEGGMLTTNDENVYETAKLLSSHGIVKNEKTPWERDCIMPSYNFRMSNINASIGCSQMDKIDEIIRLRQLIASIYDSTLNREFFDLPITHPKATHVYQMYTVKLKIGLDRNMFVKRLRGEGIEASVHFFPPVHRQTAYFNMDADLTVTDVVSKRIVSLPIYPSMNSEDIIEVSEKCNKIAEELS